MNIEFDLKTTRLEFRGLGNGLIVNPRPDETGMSYQPASVPTSRVIDNQYGGADSDSPWFVFFHENCAWPSYWIVRAESWESAYEEFLDEQPEADPSDLADAGWDPETSDDLPDGFSWDSSGRIVYSECIMGHEIELISATRIAP